MKRIEPHVIAALLLLTLSPSACFLVPHSSHHTFRTLSSPHIATSTPITLYQSSPTLDTDEPQSLSTNYQNTESPSTTNETPEAIQALETAIDKTILPPNAALELPGRLLCSSQCAYSLSSPYFSSAAYRPGTTAKRITRGVNSALVGITHDGICVAFRGTQASNPLDWLQNAALFLKDIDELSFVENGERIQVGRVHAGFYRAAKSLWKPIVKQLMEMIQICDENGWKKDIILTGHSKGGAMASVAALLLFKERKVPNASQVVTFASAKVGNTQFKNVYNAHIPQVSYEAHLDLIPFLPPSQSTMEDMEGPMEDMVEGMLWSETSAKKKESYKWDYQTVGERRYINEVGDIVEPVTAEIDKERIRNIEKRTFLSLDEFRAAHCSSCVDEGCAGSYFMALAGDVCNMCAEDDDDDELSNDTKMDGE